MVLVLHVGCAHISHVVKMIGFFEYRRLYSPEDQNHRANFKQSKGAIG